MQSLGSIKDPRAGLRLQNLLGEAGFVQVELEMIRVPLCAWSAGMNPYSQTMSGMAIAQINVTVAVSANSRSNSDPPKQERIGEIVQKHVVETMRSLAILPLTKMLGMSIMEVDDLIQRAAVDATNPSLKPYFSL
jgi:hypothetical protein